MKDIKIDLQKYDTCKVHLTISVNFVSSIDNNEEQVIQSKSDNKEFMSHDKADEVIKELFEPILSTYQIGLEKSTKGSVFIFDGVNLPYYKCHKTNFKRGGSYVDFLD